MQTSKIDQQIPLVSMENAAELVLDYMEYDSAVMLLGPPGVGKTSLAHQTAAALTLKTGKPWECKVEQAILSDPTDVKGLPDIVRHEGFSIAKWAQADMLPRVDRDGPRGIFCIDEINAASPAVMASFMRLVLEKRVGDYVMPEGWRIMATGNRQSDRAAANRMPTALASRFSWLEIAIDKDSWLHWADDNGLDPYLIAWIAFKGEDALYKMPVQGDVFAFPNPRAWAECNKYLAGGEKHRKTLVGGKVGVAAANEFEQFMLMTTKIPKIEEIIKNPANAMVPDQAMPGMSYAVARMLIRHAEKKNFGAIWTYVQRLEVECTVMTIVDAARKDADLMDTSAYAEFCIKHKDVLL